MLSVAAGTSIRLPSLTFGEFGRSLTIFWILPPRLPMDATRGFARQNGAEIANPAIRR
jgi:hypothetical protein